MTEQLTGYEASSVAEIGAILDASPADADQVYLDTIAYSERAIAAVAAKRAGGGSTPTSREDWAGSGVAIAANDFAWLTWDSSVGPDAVLDNSIPAHPTVITAGVYIVSIVVRAGGDASAHFDIGLFLDRTGFNASQVVRVFEDPETNTGDTSIAFAWYIPEAGEVAVGVDYFTPGVAAASAAITFAHIQRVA